MTEIFTAKTVGEAKAAAAKKFGRKINEIRFEIIEEGKKGFLGIGQVDAKVKATYIAPVQKPVAMKAPKAESIAKKPAEATVPKAEPAVKKPAEATVQKAETAAKKPAEVTVPKAEMAVEKPAEATVPKAEPTAQKTAQVTVPKAEMAVEKTVEMKATKSEPESVSESKSDDECFSLDDYTIVEDESMLHAKVKIARDYITSILKAMDIDVTYTIYQNETGAVINIESNNNGTVIGRRGETLDSIQYLCSIIANKGDKDYFRITIDCLGYRSKRMETLQQLAAKVSKSVIRTGRSQQLEPMNPYERRIIHSAVSGIEGVSSRSVGEEPYRKIIISSTNPKSNSRGRGKGGRHDDRRSNNRNRSERRSREPFESKAIDVSTSFEKEYKKPKPEDSMEGGLYGKIEF